MGDPEKAMLVEEGGEDHEVSATLEIKTYLVWRCLGSASFFAVANTETGSSIFKETDPDPRLKLFKTKPARIQAYPGECFKSASFFSACIRILYADLEPA